MRLFVGLLALFAGGFGAATVQEPDERPALVHYNLGKEGLALGGYDPVAYFPEGGGKPQEGGRKLGTTYRGVAYYFSSERNRAAFVANPARYEPAYGGWCAWAMADGKGDKVDVDPESFLIEEGRLLVFYDGFLADTRKKWLKKGGEECHPVADTNWSRMSGEAPRRELAHFALDGGLALGGYDPIAYFTDEPSATKGQAAKSYTHEGVTYHFTSDANKATFAGDPERFEPRYGGWCAYAMSKGEKVAVDPQAFLVQRGQLLLFEASALAKEWREAPERYTQAADSRWAAFHERRRTTR